MRKWIVRILFGVGLLIVAGGVALWLGWIEWPGRQSPQRGPSPAEEIVNQLPTVPVQRADQIIEDLQLAGKLKLRTVREVKAPFSEAIATINVAVGDQVQAEDELMTLDRSQLTVELDRAWLELTSARQTLADLTAPSTPLERLAAETELLAAREALTKLLEGPSPSEVQAAALSIREAEIALETLQQRNDPNSSEVRQARYALQQAENAVIDAQRAYDAVSWRGGEEAAAQASALQNATIALENARLTYEEAIAPPDELEIQAAQLAIDQAKNSYAQLFAEATSAEVAQAKLQVAEAEDALAQLEAGPLPQEIQEAEAAVLTALTEFEAIRADLLSGSAILAPIEGLVTQVMVTEGQVVERGDTVATIAALDAFEINLNVSEEYILALDAGMPVRITVDVAPTLVLTGTVLYISLVDTDTFSQDEGISFEPASSSPASYPVVVQVDASSALTSLRAGMNVQVTFVGSNQLPPNSWLVPMSSIQRPSPDSETGTIQLLRDGTPQEIEVTVTAITQGEWQVVTSGELQEGDQVVGFVTSFLGDTSSFNGFGPGPAPPRAVRVR